MSVSGKEKSRQSPSPAGNYLSQTISSFSRDGWNSSMMNTFQAITNADKKEAEKNMKSSTATFIVKSLDPKSGKCCLKPEEFQKLLQIYNEMETTKEPTQESSPSGVDSGAAKGQKRSAPVPTQTSSASKGMVESREVDRKHLEPGKSVGSPKQAKKTDIKQEQTSEVTTPVGTSGQKPNRFEKGTNASEVKKPKSESEQKSDTTAGVRSDPHKAKDFLEKRVKELKELSEKREQELKEKEEECQALSKKIEEKDKTWQKLEGDVKKLENENKKMESELNKAKEDRDERQNVVHDLEGKLERLNSENTGMTLHIRELQTKFKEERTKTADDIKKLTLEKAALEGNFEKLRKYMDKVCRENQKKIDDLIEDNEKGMRSLNSKLSEVMKERDDLKTRFSKLAGAKLTDQNADIADLSDPNRAMKVSEKFGQLYDDEWTDAFEELKKKKMEGKDAIQLLLRILRDCHMFCNKLKEAQIDSLNNVLLHPSQDVTKFANEHRKNVGGLKERPRISSKDEKAVRSLRRQIGVSNTCIEEIKQVFVLETKSWVDGSYDKKHLEVCKPYLEKCAEVCWLMVLHDPPLYMKMDASHGDKMDPNLYTVYSTSGEKINYLVWPPLYNEAGGGLITKGVAECLRIVKKN